MAKILKAWSGVGLAALGATVAANAATVEMPALKQTNPGYILIQDEAGEGGEGGGEGGGAGQATYSLSSTNPDDFQFDADEQIDAYVDLARSSYEKSAQSAASLAAAIAALLADPTDETMTTARQAWIDARPAYLKTEAFRFYDGPIEAVEGEINAWPMNEAFIDYVEGNPNAGLINDPAFDLDIDELVEFNQNTDEADVTTGWHAIEFLLWGQDLSVDGPGNRPVSDYIAGQGNNDRRRTYLELTTAKLAADVTGLAQAWNEQSADSYAATLKSMPEREVIGRMLNGMAILAGYEFMSERLAVALDSGDQEDEHSCFSDNTKNDFLYDLQGIKQVWSGDADGAERAGLDELLRSQDAALADQIEALLLDAEAKIIVMGDRWDQVLAAEPGSPPRLAAEELVIALQALGSGLTKAGAKLGVLVLIPSG